MANWYRPATLEEALSIRAEHPVIPIAGGTDLYVRHRRGNGLPPAIDKPLLSVSHLTELRAVAYHDDHITVGAAVPYSDLLADERVPEILRASIAELAAPALRNAGTLGGNICNASPAADAVCPLYALDAECELRSTTETRMVPIEELITGPGRTSLGEDELLTAIRIPLPSGAGGIHSFYRKVGTRRANALSKLSIAAVARLGEEGEVASAAVALGAVAPTVLRSRETEASIVGTPVAIDAARERILGAYRELVSPIDDQRSSAAYRREVAVNLVRQFLDELAGESHRP